MKTIASLRGAARALWWIQMPFAMTVGAAVPTITPTVSLHSRPPNGATSIANDAFSGCTRITSVTIPRSVMADVKPSFCWTPAATE